jgi:YD repeat-containing protein
VGCCLERIIDGNHEVFAYDFLCQLTNDNGRSASYDSLHRRLETEGKAASHNARHQILSQGDRVFHYDIDGRRTDDDRYTYTYDACDRLIGVDDGTTKVEYTYDPFNRRLSSTKYINEDGGRRALTQERFFWHDDCEIGSVGADSSLQSLRILGEGLGGEIGAAVAFEVNGEVFVPIHDLSGHVRACVNSQGETASQQKIEAFGEDFGIVFAVLLVEVAHQKVLVGQPKEVISEPAISRMQPQEWPMAQAKSQFSVQGERSLTILPQCI